MPQRRLWTFIRRKSMLSTAFTYINAFKEGGVESNHIEKKLSVVCLQNIAHECNYNPRHKCKRSAGSGNGTEHSMRKNSKYGSGKKIKSAVAESGRWIESYLDCSALRIRSVVHQVRGCLHHTSKNCNSNPQIPAHLFSMSLGVVEIMPWTILGFQKVQF